MSLRSWVHNLVLPWLGDAFMVFTQAQTGVGERGRDSGRDPYGLAVLRELDLCPRSPEANGGGTLIWAFLYCQSLMGEL